MEKFMGAPPLSPVCHIDTDPVLPDTALSMFPRARLKMTRPRQNPACRSPDCKPQS